MPGQFHFKQWARGGFWGSGTGMSPGQSRSILKDSAGSHLITSPAFGVFPWNIRFSCRQLGWGAFLSFVPKNLAGWATSALLGLLQNSKIQGGIFVTAGTWGGCVTELSREIHQKSELGDLKMANVKRLKGQRPWAAQQKTQKQFWKLESPKCFNSPSAGEQGHCGLHPQPLMLRIPPLNPQSQASKKNRGRSFL